MIPASRTRACSFMCNTWAWIHWLTLSIHTHQSNPMSHVLSQKTSQSQNDWPNKVQQLQDFIWKLHTFNIISIMNTLKIAIEKPWNIPGTTLPSSKIITFRSTNNSKTTRMQSMMTNTMMIICNKKIKTLSKTAGLTLMFNKYNFG